MLYHTKNRVVDAIQFTGPESVADIQLWLHPQSPLYGPPRNSTDKPTLTIIVRNRPLDVQYPSIAPHYEQRVLTVGSWILRDNDGELSTMIDSEFTERFEALPLPEPMPVDVAGEGSVLEIRPEVTIEQPAPGDDVDPTGVVPGVPVDPSLGDF